MKVIARAVLLFVLLTVAVCANSRAALALSTNGWTTPRAYSGACPTNIQLNGLITGDAGASVQWSFSYLNPATGKSVTLPTQTGTIDSSGRLQVTASVQFDSTMAGNSSVAFYAQEGTTSAASTITPFSVTCTSTSTPAPPSPAPPAASPTPIPQGGGTATAPPSSGGGVNVVGGSTGPIPGGFNIAAPAVSLSMNPADCAQHASSLPSAQQTCQDAFNKGNAILVWSWRPSGNCAGCVSRPDGYHVYTLDAVENLAQPALDATTSDVTFSTQAGGRCYDVLAYINVIGGIKESPWSNLVCPPIRAAVRPPAPSGLTSTVDGQVCGQHGGSIGCAAALPQGQLVLVWNYCNGCVADLFRVYRVDGGQHTRVFVTDDGLHSVAFFAPPPEGFNGKCYTVTAVQAASESSDSQSFCIGNGSVIATITLKPARLKTDHRWVYGNTGFMTPNQSTPDDQPQNFPIMVGFDYRTEKHTSGDKFWNDLFRTAVQFDLSSLAQKTIDSAKLELQVDYSTVGSDYHTDHEISCATELGVATQWWWAGYSQWFALNNIASPGLVRGPNFAINVTSTVAAWAGGATNYGFVLYQDDENWGAFTENSCLTEFNTPVLEVKYH